MPLDRHVVGKDGRFAERHKNERGSEESRHQEKHIVKGLRQRLARDELREFALQKRSCVRVIGRDSGYSRRRMAKSARARMRERLAEPLAVKATIVLQPCQI